jgi:hypothetical protein
MPTKGDNVPSILYVTNFVPSDVGHGGGDHRAYQIVHDLESVGEKINVVTVSYPRWLQSLSISPLGQVARRVGRRFSYYATNPFKFLGFSPYSTKVYSDSGFASYYESILGQVPKPVLCIIEHSGFVDLLRINERYAVPTVSCFGCIDSLDGGIPHFTGKTWGMYATSIDFVQEFRVLARCSERLFGSKIEAGVISGLGLHSHHYPYRPVGEIEQRLVRIREQRAKGEFERGLLLLVGSATVPRARASLAWFIENARKYGLPKGVKVVVVGSQTDELLARGDALTGMDLRGWVDQGELEWLMIHARAALVPDRFGFGGITRLPEFACVGIPFVTTKLHTYAIDPPPGFNAIDDSWETWCSKMENLALTDAETAQSDYEQWVKTQPKTLVSVVEDMLAAVK